MTWCRWFGDVWIFVSRITSCSGLPFNLDTLPFCAPQSSQCPIWLAFLHHFIWVFRTSQWGLQQYLPICLFRCVLLLFTIVIRLTAPGVILGVSASPWPETPSVISRPHQGCHHHHSQWSTRSSYTIYRPLVQHHLSAPLQGSLRVISAAPLKAGIKKGLVLVTCCAS